VDGGVEPPSVRRLVAGSRRTTAVDVSTGGPTEPATALEAPAGWRLRGNALLREIRLRDFAEAWGYMGRLAEAAVDYDRRPDMTISYNYVRLAIVNPHHAGITAAELRLAAKVDAVSETG
jgi:4a-hydroxytetrahydrobiopterin dehydratase